MNIAITHDDGNLIWFDFNMLNVEELDNTVLSCFDITNMPVYGNKRDMFGKPNPYGSPKAFELKNYYVSFFYDIKSETGCSCMCVNKNREIYKSKIGYINGKPCSDKY